MKTLAAILVETGKPLVLAELEIPQLKPGQTVVEIVYSGVCHTQLLEARGRRGEDRFLPHCLGHEGSGIVHEIGPGVTKVKPGDRVILSWIKGLGADVPGTVYQWEGRNVNAGGVTTFSRHAVVSENRLTKVPESISMQDAALLGCAAPTGLGSVFNTAVPKPGESAVIFGVGGVGLCAVAGAAIAGCAPVIAVDVLADKLALAKKMGATHVVDASAVNPEEEIARLVPGGADIAIEASGRPEVMRRALACVRMRGGRAVVLGNAHFGEKIELDPGQLNMGKRLLGCWGGDAMPDADFPRYCALLREGRLDLSPLVSKTYSLEEINSALDDLEAGRAARPMIDLGGKAS